MTTYAELEAKVKQKQKRNAIGKQLLHKVKDTRRKIKEMKDTQHENPESILNSL